jgi:Fe-S-cluster-containing dehydrogenase component
MVMDLKRCIGCHTCVVACKSEHNTPARVFQTLVLDREIGVFPETNRVFIPVLCNQCAEPACVEVCPKEATFIREDGVVMIDFERCIGCGSCVEHCPYQARSLVQDNRTLFPDGRTVFEKPVHERIPKRVAVKCDFCFHRLDRGGTPACVEACPTEARIFGDLADPDSTAARLIAKFAGWKLKPEAGTEPNVYYLG